MRQKQIQNSMKKKFATTDSTLPGAWIVKASDRGRKSIKKGNRVYLKDGQNFEVELFNPLQDCILSDIRVNGKSVSESGLVLRPGERFYLDCFLDDKKKFVFKTYQVEDNLEAKKAIDKNGLVEVYFYKEDTLHFKNWTKRYDKVIERVYYPTYYPHYPYWTYYPWTYSYPNLSIYGNTTYCSGELSTTTIDGGSFSYTSGGGTSTSSSYSTTDDNFWFDTKSKTLNVDNINISGDVSINGFKIKPNVVETGRVEKGNKSNQQFTEIDMEFQKNHISSIYYHLLPESQKPVETKDLKKKRCIKCGSKLKGNEKYCSNCGNKL